MSFVETDGDPRDPDVSDSPRTGGLLRNTVLWAGLALLLTGMIVTAWKAQGPFTDTSPAFPSNETEFGVAAGSAGMAGFLVTDVEFRAFPNTDGHLDGDLEMQVSPSANARVGQFVAIFPNGSTLDAQDDPECGLRYEVKTVQGGTALLGSLDMTKLQTPRCVDELAWEIDVDFTVERYKGYRSIAPGVGQVSFTYTALSSNLAQAGGAGTKPLETGARFSVGAVSTNYTIGAVTPDASMRDFATATWSDVRNDERIEAVVENRGLIALTDLVSQVGYLGAGVLLGAVATLASQSPKSQPRRQRQAVRRTVRKRLPSKRR